MKHILKFIAFIFLLTIVIFISCNKELKCYDCKENKPPIANAGRDTTITLPKDSVLLDGSASSDPDGTITSFKWAKIAGPVSANVEKPDSAKTTAKASVAGVYQFELTVTDNGRLSAKDTLQVLVDNPGVNQPPVACAGADKTITLPTDTVTLDGSCSADPDNNITSYAWTKISGPASNIATPNAVQTRVTNLVQGVYQFELKVTDAGNLSSRDTIQVIVKGSLVTDCGDTNRSLIKAKLTLVGKLSQPRAGMDVASAGNKILFAGGGSSIVDILDLTTNTWSIANLSLNRYSIGVIGAGNKVFFVGGVDTTSNFFLKVVDIYDASTNSWTVSQLPADADGLTGAAVGDKVFFAGGNYGIYAVSTVYIYNLTTKAWSTSALSTPRNFITAVVANNKAYFSGGDPWTGPSSNVIDIFDNVTGIWSTTTLQVARAYHAAIALNGVLYFAGGKTSTSSESFCSVETLLVNSGARSLMNLSGPASFYPNGQNVVVKDNKIVFFGGNQGATRKFDIYDASTNSWSIGVLPIAHQYASMISVNNTIYVAGGIVNGIPSDKVYKLEF